MYKSLFLLLQSCLKSTLQLKQLHGKLNALRSQLLSPLSPNTFVNEHKGGNAEFNRLVSVLMEFLGISSISATTLLQTALAQRARYGNIDILEICALLYHAEEGYLLESLLVMVSMYEAETVPMESRRLIQEFVHAWSTQTPPLPILVLQRLESLDKEIIKSDPDQVSAQSTQTTGLSATVVKLHQQKLKDERQRLGYLLISWAGTHKLSGNEFLVILDKLKTFEMRDIMDYYLLVAAMVNLFPAQKEGSLF